MDNLNRKPRVKFEDYSMPTFSLKMIALPLFEFFAHNVNEQVLKNLLSLGSYRSCKDLTASVMIFDNIRS